MDKDPNNFLKRILERYVIAPLFVIVCMWLVGAVIDGALRTNNTFTIILISAGGIGVIGYYFRKFWKHSEETRNGKQEC